MRIIYLLIPVLLLLATFFSPSQPTNNKPPVDKTPISITTAAFDQEWKQNAVVLAEKIKQKDRIFGDGIIRFIGPDTQTREESVWDGTIVTSQKRAISESVVDVECADSSLTYRLYNIQPEFIDTLSAGQNIYFEGIIGKYPVSDIQKIIPINIYNVKVDR